MIVKAASITHWNDETVAGWIQDVLEAQSEAEWDDNYPTYSDSDREDFHSDG